MRLPVMFRGLIFGDVPTAGNSGTGLQNPSDPDKPPCFVQPASLWDHNRFPRLHKGQAPLRENTVWTSKVDPAERDPYLNEWNELMNAIRNDKPYNEVKRGVEASLVTSMGRASAHIGQEVTFEQMLNSDQEFAPDVDKFKNDSAAPVQADASGKYPVPEPGKKGKREY